MSTQQPSIQGLQRAATAALREHWVLFLVEGVVLLVLTALLLGVASRLVRLDRVFGGHGS